MQLRNKGDEDKAIQFYYQCLTYDKNHLRASMFLAALLAKQGNVQKACKYYRHALNIDTDNEYAHFSLGKLLYNTPETRDTALKHFK